ncbi:MAG TPA: alpha/beta fold hydrolase [Chloroflexia bacterium]|nr:alpha/beta fold hydrolase [Chloroflexia bacterium]
MSDPVRIQEVLPYQLASGEARTLEVFYTDPTRVPRGRTPVILVHGIWGDMRIWQSGAPEPLPVPENGLHRGPPFRIPRTVQVDAPWEHPTGLWETLEQAGFPTLSWKQNDASGGLPGETDRELAAVIAFALQTYGSHTVYLVAHSRGGVVCRAYLMDPHAAANVRALVTIGTPHWGSRLPAIPGQMEAWIVQALFGLLGLPGHVLAWFATSLITRMINDFTARQLADFDMLAWREPPNPRLQAVMAQSSHQHIHYVAIAGVYPHVRDARIYHYELSSYLPQGWPPQFLWEETTYPAPDQPAMKIPLSLSKIADRLNITAWQAMPEWYAESAIRPEGGDGVVSHRSAWFADEERNPAHGYIKNYKFAWGHSLLTRQPEVQQTILAELMACENL